MKNRYENIVDVTTVSMRYIAAQVFLFLLIVFNSYNYAQELVDKELKTEVSLQKQFLRRMFKKADSLVTAKKIKEAQQVFDKAFNILKIAPHNDSTLYYTRLVEEFYSEVLADYDRALYIIDFLDKKCVRNNDEMGQMLLARRVADLYNRQSQYIYSLRNLNKSLALAEKNNYRANAWNILIGRGVLFSSIGDEDLAIRDYKKALEYIEEGDPNNFKRHTYVNLSDVFPDTEPDSAIYYSRLALRGCKQKSTNLICAIAYNNLAWGYYLKKKPQKAKNIILNNIGLENKHNEHSFLHDLRPAMMHILGVSEFDLGNYKASLKYLKIADQSYKDLANISDWVKVKEDLSKTHEVLGNLSESIRIHKEIKNLEVSQFRIKIAKEIAREESKRMLVAQEDEICGLEEKNDSIEQEVYNTRWLIYALAFVLFAALCVLVYLGYRSRIRYYQVNEQLVLTKLTSLRMSMNPHFLFNTFSTLQNFILKKDNRSANEYMTELSGLIRNVLNTSDSVYIDFVTELQILKSYVNLQKGRFRGEFDAVFTVDPKLRKLNPKIPSMIIQPVIENAILHGFSNIKKEGELMISFVLEGDTVCCVVKDNGIGRAASAAIKATATKNSHLSIATKNTNERLAILNKTAKEKSSIEINDLQDALGAALGTEVVIILPIVQNDNTIAI